MHQLRHCLAPACLVAIVSCVVLTSDRDTDTLTATGVDPLAKAQGWRDGLGHVGSPFAVLEIAPDRATAELAWQQNVPDTLPTRTDVLEGLGIYGDLDGVNFDREAVVVWSSGESGTCPGWLADIHTTQDGTVEVKRREHAPALSSRPDVRTMCTLDYIAFRMVLAVDRNRLPDLGSLPSEDIVGAPDGIVAVYPYDPPRALMRY